MSEIKKGFDDAGLVICKGVLPIDLVASWRAQYDVLHNAERVVEFNPVAVNEPALEPVLNLISTCPIILDVVEQLFGPDIALYNKRFVVKDKHARAPVFLHQDTPYHIGWPTKASVFVALSRVMSENGGMAFYPGTHFYGYLGDAGEISRLALPSGAPICPELTQGDFVVMHSALWHESGANVNGIDRVLADIHYQPADDPSGIELMRGQWRTPYLIPKKMRDRLLVRSRVSRLKELQAELDKFSKCSCEEPWTLGVVHRKDKPCYWPERRAE